MSARRTSFHRGTFPHPSKLARPARFSLSGFELEPAGFWQSNGGPSGHPDKTKPLSLEIVVPDQPGPVSRVVLVGCFGLWSHLEERGCPGATLLVEGVEGALAQMDLIHGRHYSDPRDLSPIQRFGGDGSSVETLGVLDLDGAKLRVDSLVLDLPAGPRPTRLIFRDLGTPASFVLLEVIFEVEPMDGCPFRAASGGIPLSELAGIVRVGDRVRFNKAVDQLCTSVLKMEDLDEARGQVLTFLAIVTAATLELGGSRAMHRVQLEAARNLDTLGSLSAISEAARVKVEEVAAPMFASSGSPSEHLIDRAIAIINRNFAKELSDTVIASQLGLSTSHFRYLFKEITGQPFHRYLISLRLERARQMLLEADLPVSEVAEAVGFGGLAHFSRAFTQRFSVNPSQIRRSVPV